MENSVTDLIEELQMIADDFYQNKMNKGIKKMPELIRKLSEFVPHLRSGQQESFLVILKGIMEAMEMKNYIMLADMLVFDVKEMMEEYLI